MKIIKKYWFTVLYGVLLALALFIDPLTGKEFTALNWRSAAYIFMLLLVEEGIRKENLLLPLFKLLNSMRSTSFLFFVLLASSFILSLFFFDFMVILIMLPFTIRLLKESNKAQYTASAAALLTLVVNIGGIITPLSRDGLLILFESSEGFVSYLASLLPPFLTSLAVFVLEALLLLKNTKRDEIYLHIENEDYWDNSRKGIRILYPAFFLVLVFGVNFNTIDLLLVVLTAFLILDRAVYKSVDYGLYITLLFIMLIGGTLKESALSPLYLSFALTRYGALNAGGLTAETVRATLPGVLLSVSFPFIYALRELKDERKTYVKTYVLLAVPHFIVYLLFALI